MTCRIRGNESTWSAVGGPAGATATGSATRVAGRASGGLGLNALVRCRFGRGFRGRAADEEESPDRSGARPSAVKGPVQGGEDHGGIDIVDGGRAAGSARASRPPRRPRRRNRKGARRSRKFRFRPPWPAPSRRGARRGATVRRDCSRKAGPPASTKPETANRTPAKSQVPPIVTGRGRRLIHPRTIRYRARGGRKSARRSNEWPLVLVVRGALRLSAEYCIRPPRCGSIVRDKVDALEMRNRTATHESSGLREMGRSLRGIAGPGPADAGAGPRSRCASACWSAPSTRPTC